MPGAGEVGSSSVGSTAGPQASSPSRAHPADLPIAIAIAIATSRLAPRPSHLPRPPSAVLGPPEGVPERNPNMRAISPVLCLVATLTTGLVLAPQGASAAAPQVAPTNLPEVQPTKPVAIKRIAKLEAKNGAAVPGERRNVEATLTAGQSPLAGKTVRFKVRGKEGGPNISIVLGTAVTNAQGKATLEWEVPELAQAGYTLAATFAGDDDTRAASDEANFAIFKAMTTFDVAYNYGALDAHGGPHFGTLLIALRRDSDDEALTKTFKVTINEGLPTQAIKDYTTTNGFVTVLLPSDTNTWKVKLQFFGDAANQATQHDKTYSH